MKLRVARHTSDLARILSFYTELVGLELLGEFNDHDGYSGIFLGKKEAGWHLEFTISKDKPIHTPDEDDILVFYTESENEYNTCLKRFTNASLKKIVAKNPYWNHHGTCYLDPDGFPIIIAKKTPF